MHANPLLPIEEPPFSLTAPITPKALPCTRTARVGRRRSGADLQDIGGRTGAAGSGQYRRFHPGPCLQPDASWLLACDLRNRCLWRLDLDSGSLSEFARGASGGHRFKIPNYASFARDGTLYVSDSGTFREIDGRILRFDRDHSGNGEIWHEGPFNFANGLALSPEEDALYVVCSFTPALSALKSCRTPAPDVAPLLWSCPGPCPTAWPLMLRAISTFRATLPTTFIAHRQTAWSFLSWTIGKRTHSPSHQHGFRRPQLRPALHCQPGTVAPDPRRPGHPGSAAGLPPLVPADVLRNDRHTRSAFLACGDSQRGGLSHPPWRPPRSDHVYSGRPEDCSVCGGPVGGGARLRRRCPPFSGRSGATSSACPSAAAMTSLTGERATLLTEKRQMNAGSSSLFGTSREWQQLHASLDTRVRKGHVDKYISCARITTPCIRATQ